MNSTCSSKHQTAKATASTYTRFCNCLFSQMKKKKMLSPGVEPEFPALEAGVLTVAPRQHKDVRLELQYSILLNKCHRHSSITNCSNESPTLTAICNSLVDGCVATKI